jgi:hypothetical protein
MSIPEERPCPVWTPRRRFVCIPGCYVRRLPHPPLTRRSVGRKGTLVPVVAAALLLILAILALVVDRLWLDAVQVELRGAAEAAALAGARGLADDDRLKPYHPPEALAKGAAWMASSMAGQSIVAGRPLELEMDRDVSVGTYAVSATTGERELLTNVADPRTVVVRPAFLKSRNNPLALLMRGLHGPDVAEMIHQAEASVDNQVWGVRPVGETRVPALPLAILHRETTDAERPSWEADIERREGADRYGFDLETRRILETSDGIPEMELTASLVTGDGRNANLAVLGLGNELSGDLVAGQVATGLSAVDLERVGGELCPSRSPFEIGAKHTLSTETLNALEALRGEARIVLLYSETGGGVATGGSLPRVRCVQLVACRVVAVRRNGAGAAKLIVQPAVMATRTALRSSEIGSDEEATGSLSHLPPNKYIYHLGLSH